MIGPTLMLTRRRPAASRMQTNQRALRMLTTLRTLNTLKTLKALKALKALRTLTRPLRSRMPSGHRLLTEPTMPTKLLRWSPKLLRLRLTPLMSSRQGLNPLS